MTEIVSVGPDFAQLGTWAGRELKQHFPLSIQVAQSIDHSARLTGSLFCITQMPL
jgi:hypothetical protein